MLDFFRRADHFSKLAKSYLPNKRKFFICFRGFVPRVFTPHSRINVTAHLVQRHRRFRGHIEKTLYPGALSLVCILAIPTTAKDLGVLTRMLYAAFLAEQSVALCIVTEPAFASALSGPMGDIHDYTRHIKAEITTGLTETETLSLVKSAADIARAESLQALRNLHTDGHEGPEIETARIAKWCQTVVKPLVRQVIDTHDNHHAEIDQLLETAKKD